MVENSMNANKINGQIDIEMFMSDLDLPKLTFMQNTYVH